MTPHAIPCQQFKGINRPSQKKRNEVYIDQLSVDLCLGCPLPVEECRGAPSAHLSYDNRPARCAYERAIAERKVGPRMVRLQESRPDRKVVNRCAPS